MNKATNKNEILKNWITRIVMIIFSLLVLVPLLWTITSSLKSTKEFYNNPWALPVSFRFQNYVNAFTKAKMGTYMWNSVFVTVLSLAILMVLAVPSAYALSRYKFRFSKVIIVMYMAGLFIQPVYTVVPLFMIMNKLKMLDSLLGLSLIYAVSALPFSIYILIAFMKTLPKDYEEAAKIDGCTYTQTLVRIIVPLAKPGIITMLIFNFMGFWNEYPLAFTLISNNKKKTLPVGLQNLMEVQRFATDWGALFAGLVIVMIPTILVYSMLHKKLTEGVNIGGIKG